MKKHTISINDFEGLVVSQELVSSSIEQKTLSCTVDVSENVTLYRVEKPTELEYFKTFQKAIDFYNK